jgi:hypothetical protein
MNFGDMLVASPFLAGYGVGCGTERVIADAGKTSDIALLERIRVLTKLAVGRLPFCSRMA